MSLPCLPTPALCCAEGSEGGRGARLAPDETRPQAEGGMEQPPLQLKIQKIWRSSREWGKVRSPGPWGAAPSLSPPRLGIYSSHPQPFEEEVEIS